MTFLCTLDLAVERTQHPLLPNTCWEREKKLSRRRPMLIDEGAPPHDIIKWENKGQYCLCETEILASCSNGSEDLLSKCLVALVLREVKF